MMLEAKDAAKFSRMVNAPAALNTPASRVADPTTHNTKCSVDLRANIMSQNVYSGTLTTSYGFQSCSLIALFCNSTACIQTSHKRFIGTGDIPVKSKEFRGHARFVTRHGQGIAWCVYVYCFFKSRRLSFPPGACRRAFVVTTLLHQDTRKERQYKSQLTGGRYAD
jgi:hypothetical protein